LSALLASAIWLHLATHLGLPVSTTHSIVGAVLGVGLVSFGVDGVQWGELGQIVASWFVSPLLGGVLAFLTFGAIRRLILRTPDPVEATRRYSPYIVGTTVSIMTLSFIYKVLQNRFEAPPVVLSIFAAVTAGVAAGVIAGALLRATRP